MHRQKRYECKPRNTEISFANPCRSIVSWPSAIADAITFNVTLFKSKNQEYNEKDWTLIVEEVLKNKSSRPLAAVSLNLCLFVSYKTPIKAKFKLRSLRPEVKLCTMNLSIIPNSFDEKTCENNLNNITFDLVQKINDLPKENLKPIEEKVLDQSNKTLPKSIENVFEKKENSIDLKLHKLENKTISTKKVDDSSNLFEKNTETEKPLTNDIDTTDNLLFNDNSEKNELKEEEEKTNDRLMLQEVERLGQYLKKKMKHIEDMTNSPLIVNITPFKKVETPKIQSKYEKFFASTNNEQKSIEETPKFDNFQSNNETTDHAVISNGINEEMVIEDEENLPLNITTRKLTTNFEKDLQNSISCIQVDLEKMNERLVEVERLDAYIEEKMQETEAGSESERNYIEQHLKLLTEKDALVRRQDYLNVLIDLKETTSKIKDLQKQLNEITTDELYHTNKTEKLMHKLKELIDKKNELSHTLIEKEDEEEEESERSKRLVRESHNFMRGSVQPISASKRLLNWFSPKTPF